MACIHREQSGFASMVKKKEMNLAVVIPIHEL